MVSSGAKEPRLVPLLLLLTLNRFILGWRHAASSAEAGRHSAAMNSGHSWRQLPNTTSALAAEALNTLEAHEQDIQVLQRAACEDPESCQHEQSCASCAPRACVSNLLFLLHTAIGLARLLGEDNITAARERE